MWLVIQLFTIFKLSLSLSSVVNLLLNVFKIVPVIYLLQLNFALNDLILVLLRCIELIFLKFSELFDTIYFMLKSFHRLRIYLLEVLNWLFALLLSVVVNFEWPVAPHERRVCLTVVLVWNLFSIKCLSNQSRQRLGLLVLFIMSCIHVFARFIINSVKNLRIFNWSSPWIIYFGLSQHLM